MKKMSIIMYLSYCFLCSCQQSSKQLDIHKKLVNSDTVENGFEFTNISRDRIEDYKEAVDRRFENENLLQTYARLFNDEAIYKMGSDITEDSIAKIYKVLKNDKNQIVGIKEIPVSQSGDWDSAVMYYFDPNGNISAVNYEYSEFNSEVSGDVVHETLTKFFDSNGKLVKRIHNLTDRLKKPIQLGNIVFSDTTDLHMTLNAYQSKNNFVSSKVYVQATDDIKKYIIPANGNNKTILYMLDINGGKSDFTRILYYQEKTGSFDITEANFFEGNTTAIRTNNIKFTAINAIVTHSFLTNPWETNKKRIYNPTRIFLKMPNSEGSTSWSYNDDDGEVVKCIASRIDVDFENNVRKAIKRIIIQQSFPNIKSIEYYVEGIGLWKIETSENGIVKTQYEFQQVGLEQQ